MGVDERKEESFSEQNSAQKKKNDFDLRGKTHHSSFVSFLPQL